MNFFQSVFSSDPPEKESPEETSWGSFSGIVKNLVSKSEPLIQTYRRDLEEFGSGLRKETEVIREVIIEGKSSFQVLDSIGSSMLKSTAEIIAHGKDVLLSSLDEDSENSPSLDTGNLNRLSRFEVKVKAVQEDMGTFSEDPEDMEEFRVWGTGFDVDEKEDEITGILEESAAVKEFFSRLVPEVLDYGTFWGRYFYRIHKLKQAEDLRANLVKRAISGEDEDLSWEIDDEEQEKNGRPDDRNVENLEKGDVSASLDSRSQNQTQEEEISTATEIKSVEAPLKIDEKILPKGKGESPKSSKDSDVSIVSTQPSMPEDDDLGWDEIEDLGDNDDKKVGASVGNPSKIDLRKRLTSVEDDEDLSWDIEDDEQKNS